MKKTILPWLLSMVMIVTFIPVISFADEAGIVDQGTCGNNVTWALFDDGQLVIEGTGSMSNFILKESDTADTPQTPWYKYKGSITKIVIGEGVTYIGNYAFHYLDKARSVELSEGLKSIGFSAFGGCGITAISFPESLETVGRESFWNCENLTDICLSSKVSTVGEGAFQYCTRLKTIVIPDSVTSFGNMVFSDCSNLETVTMTTNASCPQAGSWTLFSDSDFLENLKTVTYTGTGSINEWNSAYSKAKTVNIGSGIKEIEDYSFAYCSRLTVINMPDSIETISNVGTFAEVNATVNYGCSSGNINKSLEGNYDGTLIWNEQHPWNDDYTIDNNATCLENGQKSIHCAVCGVVKEGTEQVIPALGHDVIIHEAQEATCTELGWEEYETCSRCDYSTYEEIRPLGHDVIIHEAQEATCTEPGWEEYETCSRCDYITEHETFPALGHTWKHYTNAAGYLQNGNEYDKCDVCGDVVNQKTLLGYSTSYVKKFKVKKGKKSFTAKWKKQSKAKRKKFSGYQLRYSTNADMSGAKTINLSKKSKSKKVKKLGKKVRYYVQIRSYVTTGAGTFYSGWSTKTVVTK